MNTAVQNVKLGVLGSGAANRAAKADVKASLNLALAYINALAEVHQDIADEIITGTLMVVIVKGVSKKQAFAVTQAIETGAIWLTSLAAMIDRKYVKATYESQFLVTPMELRVWQPMTIGTDSREKVEGCVINLPIWIRRRIKTKKNGLEAWSAVQDITPK